MRYISRSEWQARKPKTSYTKINGEGTTLHYLGNPLSNTPQSSVAQVASIVRAIQAYHMDRNGWSDIAYSFLVADTAEGVVIFEGRGFGNRTAAQGTNAGNSKSHAVCVMIGVGQSCSDGLKNELVNFCAQNGQPLRWGHYQWHSTSCPGAFLTPWVQSGFTSATVTPQPAPTPPPPAPPVDAYASWPILAKGANDNGNRNGYVYRLQARLNQTIGAGLKDDGVFWDKTDGAVRRFQSGHGLGVDGVVGKNTWRKLEELAKAKGYN